MTQAEALSRLQTMTDYNVEPEITSTRVEELLDEVRLAALWDELGTEAGDVAPAVGLVIMPTVRNGHRYELVSLTAPGEQGATEPDFPTERDSTITDGDLVWREAGPDYSIRWDLNRGACLGWQLKAGYAAAKYRSVVNDQTFDRNHIIDNCLAMAAQYEPISIA